MYTIFINTLILYNFFEVGNNFFKKNQGNGLNIQKSFYNGVFFTLNKNIQYQPIKIKDNQFYENKDFGLFINDCIIEAISNKFSMNRQSGLFLCNILIDDPKQGFSGLQKTNSNYNIFEDDFSSIIKEVKRSSNLTKNSFNENGENGLFIYGYPYLVNIYENVFCRNCKNGISVDLDTLYNNCSSKLKESEHTFSKLMFRTELKTISQNIKTTDILEAYKTSFEQYLQNNNFDFANENNIYTISCKDNSQALKFTNNNINGKQILQELENIYKNKDKTKKINSIFDLTKSDISLLPLISWLRNHDNIKRSDFNYFYEKALLIYTGLGGN